MKRILYPNDIGGIAVVVPYLPSGLAVEEIAAKDLANAKHPYTRALIRSMPTIAGTLDTLIPIEGTVPSPNNLPTGCRFQTRCPERVDGLCNVHEPVSIEIEPGHRVACFLSGSPVPQGGTND